MLVRNLSLSIAIGFFILNSACNNTADVNGPAKVEMKKNAEDQYRLFVNGNEFYVLGAGLEFGDIEALAENGGNSFRTWRTEDGQRDAVEILDEAQKYGLMAF